MDKKLIELVKLEVLGMVNQEDAEIFRAAKSEGSDFPWKELGEYQNLVALVFSSLKSESPSPALKSKIVNRIKEEIDKKLAELELVHQAELAAAEEEINTEEKPRKEAIKFKEPDLSQLRILYEDRSNLSREKAARAEFRSKVLEKDKGKNGQNHNLPEEEEKHIKQNGKENGKSGIETHKPVNDDTHKTVPENGKTIHHEQNRIHKEETKHVPESKFVKDNGKTGSRDSKPGKQATDGKSILQDFKSSKENGKTNLHKTSLPEDEVTLESLTEEDKFTRFDKAPKETHHTEAKTHFETPAPKETPKNSMKMVITGAAAVVVIGIAAFFLLSPSDKTTQDNNQNQIVQNSVNNNIVPNTTASSTEPVNENAAVTGENTTETKAEETVAIAPKETAVQKKEEIKTTTETVKETTPVENIKTNNITENKTTTSSVTTPTTTVEANKTTTEQTAVQPPKEETKKEEEQSYFVAVEEMPEPLGGIKAIQEKIVYPKVAKTAGVKGKVFVLAFVDEKGTVTKAEVVRGIGAGCDEEALSAVKKTKFKPGRQRGKPVKVRVTIPIVFQLE